MKNSKIIRCLYLLFLGILFSLYADGQTRALSYLEAPDAIIMTFHDGEVEAGIVLSYDRADETYEVLITPGTGILKISRSGKIDFVESPRGIDQLRRGTQLRSWNYFRHNIRIFRVGCISRVVLSFVGNTQDTYFGVVLNYRQRLGYRIVFFGPLDRETQYFVEIGTNLRVRRTNVPSLQGKTLSRMNVMTQVGPDNTFPY